MSVNICAGLRRLFAPLSVLLMLSSPALAQDPVFGMWQTEPDRKDLTSHILIGPCDGKICGKVMQAFNSAGQMVRTANVGRQLFWGIEPAGNGSYDNGRVFIPLMNVEARAKMTLLDQNRLRVTACKAMVCDGQVWVRIQ
ncbi:MAG: DUF2147 domain-containing protein [Pseudomonadota bacterium]